MKKNRIHFNSPRLASLVGIMLWSAHYHAGQWSREYRMGCRARQLLCRSNEIGTWLASRWFDLLEHYAAGEDPPPLSLAESFSHQVRERYKSLAIISEASFRKNKSA